MTDSPSTPRNRANGSASVSTLALVVGAAAVSFAVAYLLPAHVPPMRGPESSFLTVYLQFDLFISAFTLILLVSLFVTYARIYVALPNTFTFGLVLFTFSLVLFAATSLPYFPVLFGRPRPVDVSWYTVLPKLFASAAVVILRYQSST